jgi:hypothetical protein
VVPGAWAAVGLAGVGVVSFTATQSGRSAPSQRPAHTQPAPAALGVSWTVVPGPQTSGRPAAGAGSARVLVHVVDAAHPTCTGATYALKLTTARGPDPPVATTRLRGCTATATVRDDVAYRLSVHAKSAGGGSEVGGQRIEVRSFSIVSLGDSVASGEGNPPWIDKVGCHRSQQAGPVRAAEALQRVAVHVDVKVRSLACTGAWIDGRDAPDYLGTTRPSLLWPAVGEPDHEAPQVEQLEQLAKPDAILISVGANDIGFSKVVQFCLFHKCMSASFHEQPLLSFVDGRLITLESSYGALAKALRGRARNVYVTEYFDPLRDASNHYCRIPVSPLARLPSVGITSAEARWAEVRILDPLNRTIAAMTALNGWRFVGGIQAAFARHGYCAPQSWIVRLNVARLLRKSTRAMAFHPNRHGQDCYAQRIAEALLPQLVAAFGPDAVRTRHVARACT